MWLLLFLSICVVTHGYVPPIRPRIIGGKDMNIEEFPFIVSLRDTYDVHQCGGSILDANTILTAAHCVYGMDALQWYVRVGANKHQDGTKVHVAKIFIHTDYIDELLHNDIALLKLSTPLAYNNRVQPIKLQPQGKEVLAGTIAFVAGWGVTQPGSVVISKYLKAVNVAVVTSNYCMKSYGFWIITSNMLCASDIGRGSCQNDSGGPLVANGRLIGVVSWGEGCAHPKYPGVYTKISGLYDWIKANKDF